MRVFLRTQRRRAAGLGVEAPGFLLDRAACVEHRRLAGNLCVDSALNEAKRVDVFELTTRAELGRAARANRNVRVAAKAPLLEVAVVDTDEDEHVAQRAKVRRRFGARTKLGL